MGLLIIHNAKGKIISIAEVFPGPKANIGVGVRPKSGHSVLELQRQGESEAKSLADIQKDYFVDVKAKTLIRETAKRK